MEQVNAVQYSDGAGEGSKYMWYDIHTGPYIYPSGKMERSFKVGKKSITTTKGGKVSVGGDTYSFSPEMNQRVVMICRAEKPDVTLSLFLSLQGVWIIESIQRVKSDMTDGETPQTTSDWLYSVDKYSRYEDVLTVMMEQSGEENIQDRIENTLMSFYDESSLWFTQLQNFVNGD